MVSKFTRLNQKLGPIYSDPLRNISNAISTENDQILVIVESQTDESFIYNGTESPAFIQSYNSSNNKWTKIVSSDIMIGSIVNSVIIKHIHADDENVTNLNSKTHSLINGYIRTCTDNEIDIPVDLIKLCMKYYIPIKHEFNIIGEKYELCPDEYNDNEDIITTKCTVRFVHINHDETTSVSDADKINHDYNGFKLGYQNNTYSIPFVVSVKNIYHLLDSTGHYTWNPNPIPNPNPNKSKPGSQVHELKTVKTFKFTRSFFVKGVIYIEGKEMLLMFAEYGLLSTSLCSQLCNTLWRFDFGNKKWKRLSDLDLPYALMDIGYGVTQNEEYLVVIGRVKFAAKFRQVLVLDLVGMKWLMLILNWKWREGK